MNKVKATMLKSYMRRMTYAFVASLVGLVLAYIFMGSPVGDELPGLVTFCLLGGVAALLGFYVYLGDLAGCLGKSPIAWMSISFLTFPIGPVVAYIMMYINAHDEIQVLSAADE